MAFDKYPYTNFHELNLEWFMTEFEKIFRQWDELYTTLTEWKDSTTTELAEWREDVMSDITSWESELTAGLAEWKSDTEQDISDWETGVLSDLADWKDDFETLFDTTFDNLSQIKTDAEAARDVAVASAASISSSAAQIATNTNDIASLQSSTELESKLFSTVREWTAIPWALPSTGFSGGVRWDTGAVISSTVFNHTDYVDVSLLGKIRYKQHGIISSNINTGVAFYDINKTYVSGICGVGGLSESQYLVNDIEIPQNAKFARFTVFKDTDTYGVFTLDGISRYNIVRVSENNINDTLPELEVGGISSNDGMPASASYVSYRTIMPLAKNIKSIYSKSNSIGFRLYLYRNVEAYDYIGALKAYNKTVKVVTTETILNSIENLPAIYKMFPACKFIRMVILRRDGTSMTETEVNNIVCEYEDGNLSELKYAALGDSITYGFIPRNATGYNEYTLLSYAAISAVNLGMKFANYGENSSCVGDYGSSSSGTPMVSRWNTMADDADIISVMGGTNDIRVPSFTLGTMSSRDTTSYYGALHNIFSGLYEKYLITPTSPKNVKIFGITPIKLLRASGGTEGGTGTLYDMEPLAEAMEKVANFYGFKCLDLLHNSQINPELNQTIHGTVTGYTGWYNRYITDGTHPTQLGQYIIADTVTAFIRNLF